MILFLLAIFLFTPQKILWSFILISCVDKVIMPRVMERKLVKPMAHYWKSTFFSKCTFQKWRETFVNGVKFQLDLHEVSLNVWRQLSFVAKDKNDVWGSGILGLLQAGLTICDGAWVSFGPPGYPSPRPTAMYLPGSQALWPWPPQLHVLLSCAQALTSVILGCPLLSSSVFSFPQSGHEVFSPAPLSSLPCILLACKTRSLSEII